MITMIIVIPPFAVAHKNAYNCDHCHEAQFGFVLNVISVLGLCSQNIYDQILEYAQNYKQN